MTDGDEETKHRCNSQPRGDRINLRRVARVTSAAGPNRGAYSPHDRRDTTRATRWPPYWLHGDKSKDQCRIHTKELRLRIFLTVADSALHSDGACGQQAVWQIVPQSPFSPQPNAAVAQPMMKHQRTLQPPRLCCTPSATGRHPVDAISVQLV